MPSALRFVTLLLAMTGTVLWSGLTNRVIAQTNAPQPLLLQADGILQADDETLGDGSFYDVHEFTGQANQLVTLLLESEAFDAYLILEDDQGNHLATNNNISSDNTNAALVFALPATGHYRVIVNARHANRQGPYSLLIQSTPADQPNPLLSPVEVTLQEAKQRIQAGIMHHQRSEYQVALVQWEEALALFRSDTLQNILPQDSHQGESNSLNNLGLVYYSLGQYSRAIDFYQQSLDIDQENGFQQSEANSLDNLGSAYYSLGQYSRAIDFYQQSLDIDQELEDRQGEAISLGNLGNVYRDTGEYSRAIDAHQQSLENDQELEARQSEDKK